MTVVFQAWPLPVVVPGRSMMATDGLNTVSEVVSTTVSTLPTVARPVAVLEDNRRTEVAVGGVLSG